VLRQSLTNALRSLVVRTADVPALGRAYRGIYALQVARAENLLGDVDGIANVFVRGSKGARIAPGLSDIDIVVLLEEGSSPALELAALERVGALVRRANLGAPLIREVQVFTRLELALLAKLQDGLYSSLLVDSVAIGQGAALPQVEDAPELAAESLLRELCFRASRTLQHLFQGTMVERGLAARSYAKSLAVAGEVERGARSSEGSRRAYATGSRVTVSYADVLSMFARIDKVLPPAPEVTDIEPPSPHPMIQSAVSAVRIWFAPFHGAPGITAAVLSGEGALESDVRFYVAVDPAHPEAVNTVERLGSASRAGRFPRIASSRSSVPLVVTPTQLDRSVYLRWTATEPVARLRHGITIIGAPSTPRASLGEMQRGLVLNWLGNALRVREVLMGDLSEKKVFAVRDAMAGLAPALRAFATSGRILTRHETPPANLESFARMLREPAFRLELLRQLRDVATGPCAALLGTASWSGRR